MLKRGQAANFIIIGIVIFAIIAFFLYMRSQISTQKISEQQTQAAQVPGEVAPISNFVQLCLESSAKKAMISAGINGGYYNPKEYLNLTYFSVPFYYYKGKDYAATKEMVESTIGEYTIQNLMKCVDLSVFENEGMQIAKGEIKINISIEEGDVNFNLVYPLNITKGNSQTKIDKFSTKIDSRLSYVIEVYTDIINRTVEKPYIVDLTRILDYTVDITRISLDGFDLYIIKDNETNLYGNDSPYVYLFGIYYQDGIGEANETYTAPIINESGKLAATAGQKFDHDFKVDYEQTGNLVYIIETDLQINPFSNGIHFTPSEQMIGEYNLTLRTQDIRFIGSEGFVEKKMTLEITK